MPKHKDVATVRCYSPEEVARLQERLKALKEEYDELFEAFSALDTSS